MPDEFFISLTTARLGTAPIETGSQKQVDFRWLHSSEESKPTLHSSAVYLSRSTGFVPETD